MTVSDNQGYLHIYTGNGKGKTTAAIGLVVRAAGTGKRSLLIQFMKAGHPYSEYDSLKLLEQWIQVEQFGTDRFVLEKRKPTDVERQAISVGIRRARSAFENPEFDIIVLDEICVAVHLGAIQSEEVVQLLKDRPSSKELVLTGRYCPQAWIELADVVTEMREVKHYYRQGVLSRRGIDS